MYKPVFRRDARVFSELESCFSCALCQLRYTSVIDIAATVKYNCFDALGKCLFAYGLTDLFSCVLVASDTLEASLDGGCGDQGYAGNVVDDLGINVLVGTVNSKSGALSSTGDLSAYSGMSLKALFVLILL